MSYYQKSIWFSFLSTLLLFGYYFFRVFSILKTPGLQPQAFLWLFASIVICIIIIQITAHIIYSLRHRSEIEMGQDERDKQIQKKGTQVSYWVLSGALWLMISMIFIFGRFPMMEQWVLFALLLAEIVGYVAQLIYYRRGF